MLITGRWFPKGSAAQCEATLTVACDDKIAHCEQQNRIYSVEISNGETLTGEIHQLVIEPRLGNLERKIELADGSIFITSDNNSVDTLIANTKSNRFFLWLHRQESSFKRIILFTLIVVVFALSFLQWGVPWVSQKIAYIVPTEIRQVLGEQTLEFVDEFMLEESELEDKTKARIQQRFKDKLLPLLPDSDVNYQLRFRHFSLDDDIELANAFALPSGDIIVTDRLVEISQNPDEIDAVLLHEVGHIVNRHGLQSVVQKSLMTVIVLSVVGDTDGLADLVVGLGTAVVANRYSRDHETEADEFAFNKMLQARIDPKSFANILNRIEKDSKLSYSTKEEPILDNSQQGSDLFSTHPNTQKRAEQAERYSQCYQKELSVCE
ncbi:M48 family metallopeptidase [Pasteurella skyensis]|uniref:M48 family metallopeptidase n=1 Tax=Phocoenobacter skyensis TaxID=97481 RepID=A0AAJ6N8R7_9PAST|nr:M48 family metallopeptidase [Pasteurella skyensis]MDP8162371.1 M48 family metallopeptidase [Pasteurella skyensis]MDP8172295.1 M48 family metallopeptidase [Pasteurella skyensis]MDP8178550.1 M48 family metallopeptidase [Pasteurella skyensis]MDP8182552.1 M48 family metallopeptidase [Pasteurella skyensis]MDP8188857.1 M48 family metallopeptidase [Pasteurella skyensis]